MAVRYRKELDSISPYVPGKPIDDVKRELGLERVIKLASNENPFGFSDAVRDAVMKALEEVNLYPDGNATLLKEKIAAKYGVTPDMVLPTCGSDEMVDLIAKTFIDQGSEVVMAEVTFPRYISTSRMMGADLKIVPMKDMAYDLEGFKKVITPNTRLVWLCNPNNPTGTFFTRDQLVDIMEHISPETLVVYDEAYYEFASHPDYPKDSLDFLKKYRNMLVMKTLSKAYGIAGLRIGFTIGDATVLGLINRIRNPFNVTLITQAAAMAAIDDDDFLVKVIENNNAGKRYLYEQFEKLGLQYVKTEANHIAFNAGKDGTVVFNELLKKGVIIRPIGGEKYKTWLRVSIGTMEENQEFIKALREVL
ncbi:MAG TPA: histidinol-phosphate transaminase [Firmicutes bacterium]|jgi:histidinol-phosphate aminotransferase|nr:histidinol-phosphate transaminase [Bacillota bacterium]